MTETGTGPVEQDHKQALVVAITAGATFVKGEHPAPDLAHGTMAAMSAAALMPRTPVLLTYPHEKDMAQLAGSALPWQAPSPMA